MSEASERGGVLNQPDPSVPATRVRYGVMAFLCSLSFLTYFDRVCIMRAQEEIRADLNLTKVQIGTIMSIFWLAYGLFEIPSGWLGDRFGPRRALIRIVIAWSLFTALSGCAAGFYSLLAFRFLFGVGEAGAYPNMANVQARWLPEKTRARAGGLLWLCARWGGAFSPLIFGSMLRTLDSQSFRAAVANIPLLNHIHDLAAWRLGFFASGIIGVIWCVAFYGWFRDNPADKPSVNKAELDLIQEGRKQPASHDSHDMGALKKLFTCPSLWAMAVLYFFANFGWSFYVSWMPTYLKEVHKVEFNKSEVMMALPLFFGGISCLVGGWLCDQLVKKTGWRRLGRAIFPIAGYSISALCMFLIPNAKTPEDASRLMCIAEAAHDFGQGANWATIVDIGGIYAGMATGFINMIGNMSQFIQPPVGGYISDNYGWSVLFASYTLTYVIAISMWFFIDPRKAFYEDRKVEKPAPEPAMVPAERGGIA